MESLGPLLAFLAITSSIALAQEPAPGPVSACDFPAEAQTAPGSEPRTEAWVNLDWRPPPCLPWKADTYRFVATIEGTLQSEGPDELMLRIGAISKTKGLRYWSTTEQGWRVLIEDAVALASRDDERGRPDFSVAELKAGAPVHFRQKDNRSSDETIYSMQVLKASPDAIIVESVNLTPIASFGLTIFPPGSLHSAYIARLTGLRQWSLRVLSAAGPDASRLVALGKESYVNRALAFFRYLAQLPDTSSAR